MFFKAFICEVLLLIWDQVEWCEIAPEDSLEVTKYIDPPLSKECEIEVKYTPKEYVEKISPGEQMMSVGIPLGYYDSAIGLKGEALRVELAKIITANYKKYTYKTVWEFNKLADLNPKNNSEVWELYMEQGWPKEQTYGKDGIYKGWNREHMWAKSHGDFGTRMGPGTDFHHLRPADSRENSFRNKMNYCNVEGPRTRRGGCFEPPLSCKGDAARAIFYMATRWNLESGLYVDNDDQNVSNQPRIAHKDDLINWNYLDPVDPYEINRMTLAYQWQHNRNPYVDHPELIDYIWGQKQNIIWDGGVTLNIDQCK